MRKIARIRKMFAVLTIFLGMSLFTSERTFAWTMTADFENGTIGSKAQGTSGFSGAGTATTYSADQSVKGSKSAKMVWPAGSEGFGVCHGEFKYPNTVGNGGEVWARGYFYFASPWSWNNNSTSQFIKILRIHMANSAGQNAGYHSFIANGNGKVIASNEIADYGPVLSTSYDVGKWQCIEIYVKLSTTAPITRLWKNGELIFEDTTHKTLSSSSDYANFSYVMTQWNNGAPQQQTQYVDEFIITTDKPSQVDSKGNPMIGPISGTTTTTISAPSELKATVSM